MSSSFVIPPPPSDPPPPLKSQYMRCFSDSPSSTKLTSSSLSSSEQKGLAKTTSCTPALPGGGERDAASRYIPQQAREANTSPPESPKSPTDFFSGWTSNASPSSSSTREVQSPMSVSTVLWTSPSTGHLSLQGGQGSRERQGVGGEDTPLLVGSGVPCRRGHTLCQPRKRGRNRPIPLAAGSIPFPPSSGGSFPSHSPLRRNDGALVSPTGRATQHIGMTPSLPAGSVGAQIRKTSSPPPLLATPAFHRHLDIAQHQERVRIEQMETLHREIADLRGRVETLTRENHAIQEERYKLCALLRDFVTYYREEKLAGSNTAAVEGFSRSPSPGLHVPCSQYPVPSCQSIISTDRPSGRGCFSDSAMMCPDASLQRAHDLESSTTATESAGVYSACMHSPRRSFDASVPQYPSAKDFDNISPQSTSARAKVLTKLPCSDDLWKPPTEKDRLLESDWGEITPPPGLSRDHSSIQLSLPYSS